VIGTNDADARHSLGSRSPIDHLATGEVLSRSLT
jgi:hypothetical protein